MTAELRPNRPCLPLIFPQQKFNYTLNRTHNLTFSSGSCYRTGMWRLAPTASQCGNDKCSVCHNLKYLTTISDIAPGLIWWNGSARRFFLFLEGFKGSLCEGFDNTFAVNNANDKITSCNELNILFSSWEREVVSFRPISGQHSWQIS